MVNYILIDFPSPGLFNKKHYKINRILSPSWKWVTDRLNGILMSINPPISCILTAVNTNNNWIPSILTTQKKRNAKSQQKTKQRISIPREQMDYFFRVKKPLICRTAIPPGSLFHSVVSLWIMTIRGGTEPEYLKPQALQDIDSKRDLCWFFFATLTLIIQTSNSQTSEVSSSKHRLKWLELCPQKTSYMYYSGTI